MKTKIFVSALFILVFSAFFLSKSANAQDLYAPLGVKVLQHLSTEPAAYVRVEYKQNGTTVHSGTTDIDGIYVWHAPNGTYDIYVYKPAPPNDSQSGQLLGFAHSGTVTVTISLGAWY